MKFQELIKIMSDEGFDKLADIARELDVSPQAMNNWKSRNQVPHKIILQLQEKYNNLSPKSGKGDENGSRQDQRFDDKMRGPFSNPNSYTHLVQNNPYFEEDTISLWAIFAILKKNIALILITPTILCTLTIIYVLFIAKPVYTSSATIIPAGGESSMGKMAGMAAQFGISVPGGGSAQKMVYPEIIKSRTLAKKMLIKKFDTNEFGKKQPLLRLLTYKDKEPTVGMDVLIINGMAAFISLVTVSENMKTSIVTVSVDASEAKLAADIATALINELDLHQKQFNTKQASKKRIFIEARIEDVNVDLIRAEESLKDFRSQNRQYVDSPSLLLEFERLLREVEVQKQLYITLKREFEMAQIEEVEESDILHILDAPEIPLSRSKPRRSSTVVIAGILGLGLGTVFGFIRNWYETEKKTLIKTD